MEKAKQITISMLQMSSVIGDVEANINKVTTLLNDNTLNNTDVLVLPEVWTVGWSCKNFQKTAQNIENSSVIFYQRLQKNIILI